MTLVGTCGRGSGGKEAVGTAQSIRKTRSCCLVLLTTSGSSVVARPSPSTAYAEQPHGWRGCSKCVFAPLVGVGEPVDPVGVP